MMRLLTLQVGCGSTFYQACGKSAEVILQVFCKANAKTFRILQINMLFAPETVLPAGTGK